MAAADTVTIPRAEYAALTAAAEDLEDLQTYDFAMASRDEGMPHGVLKRIIAGENPIAVIREWRGLSMAELARRSGVNRIHLLKIERSEAGHGGSVATIKALATTLGVDVDDLV